MKTVSKKLFTKMLAGVLAVAMTIAFVPAFSAPAHAAQKYKKVTTAGYTVKLPTGKGWEQDSQKVDSQTAALVPGAGAIDEEALELTVETTLGFSFKSADIAYSSKTSKNGKNAVMFIGAKTSKKLTQTDLNLAKVLLNNKNTVDQLNQSLSGDETLSSIGEIKVNSISAKTVKVKKYGSTLKIKADVTFNGSGYSVSLKPVIYVTVKNKNVLATCGGKVTLSDNGMTVKFASVSSLNTMAKTALESVTIRK